MLLQNQIRCNNCGDTPFSSHRHHFSYCKCGDVAVDGGMDYLKRTGKPDGYTEMSIFMEDHVVKKLRTCVNEKLNNDLGKICGMMRVLRDEGYQVNKPDIKNGDC